MPRKPLKEGEVKDKTVAVRMGPSDLMLLQELSDRWDQPISVVIRKSVEYTADSDFVPSEDDD